MTSTITGLPDRYRPLDQVAPDEPTETGVIRSWRAKDRVLNRDVAIRVHTPGGDAAHAWIARSLTAGGLATPALAMVYDASEGSGDTAAPNSAAYVVNEWIEGETLAERLTRGPLGERETRTLLRRLAEGVAEAHRVGLAVGGLTPEHVVIRPNGLVGLRAVPAATGTTQGDIAALGELLDACLTGTAPTGGSRPAIPPDLAALARRARSTEPGQGLSSVAAMVALLNEPQRPRTPGPLERGADESDSGWLRRLRDRRPEGALPEAEPPAPVPPPAPTVSVDAPVRMEPNTLPPVPPTRPIVPADTAAAGTVSGGMAASGIAPPTAERRYDDPFADAFLSPTGENSYLTGENPYDTATGEVPVRRRRLVVIGIPVLALVLVIVIAWWLGTHVLSVAGSVDAGGSTPRPTASASGSSSASAAAGGPVSISGAKVFDPYGDGQPENDQDVPKSYDGDPNTAWSTLDYRNSAAFGNLKPGVGVVYDLGSQQAMSGVTIVTTTPGVQLEVRTGDNPTGSLDNFRVVASGTVDGTSDLSFDKTVTSQYVLVWITGLVEGDKGFHGDLAEVTLHAAG